MLRLKAKQETFTGPLNPPEWNVPGTGTQDYTSSKIRTRDLADWKYGRFAARIKPPKGQGMWPAFWMMPIDSIYGGWPLSGEIDIIDAINLGAECEVCLGIVGENYVHGTLPDNRQFGGKTTLPNDIQPGDDFHVYAVEWGEGRINWFVDDVLYFSAHSDDWFTSADNATGIDAAPFDQNFYMMLNLAVGGDWPEGQNEGGLDVIAVPNELVVDWVRVVPAKRIIRSIINNSVIVIVL